MKKSSQAVSAFSLVEVVLAIGIISFGVTILIALLPVGLKSNRDSTEESQAVNLMYSLISDRQASAPSLKSSLYTLPAINSLTTSTNGSLFATEEGTITTDQAKARYRVGYTLYPAAGIQQPVVMALKVSWPAMQTNQPSSVESLSTFTLK